MTDLEGLRVAEAELNELHRLLDMLGAPKDPEEGGGEFEGCRDDWDRPPSWETRGEAVNRVRALVRKAVAEEREACAKLAESMPRSWDVKAPDPQKRIAAAIRKRGE